jgi:hypothetical protein
LRKGEIGISTDLSPERRLEIIDTYGASPKATFSSMYDLISEKSCDALVQFMDASLQSDVNSGDIPTGTSAAKEGKYNAWIPFEEGGTENMYNKKLYADQIVDLIGAEETMKLIDYFHKSFGEDMTIDCMYIARHGEPIDKEFFVPWHTDDYATMEITLNDNYKGGEVLHLNEAGVHKTEARPGSVTGKRQYGPSFVSHNHQRSLICLLLLFVFLLHHSTLH